MKDLERLLDGNADELEQALLRSARTELPRASGLEGAALALGLTTATAQSLAAHLPTAGSVTAAVPTGTALAAPSAAVAGATAGAPVAGAASLALLGKGLVGGTLVSFLALTTLDHTVGLSDRPASTTVSTHSALPPAPALARVQPLPPLNAVTPPSAAWRAPAAKEAPIVVAREAPKSAPPAAPPESPRRAPAQAEFVAADAPSSPAAPASSASLSAEIRLLDRARAALGAQNLAEAERLLDLYAASRPSPVLAPEAGHLRVRLLLAAGQRREAAQLARSVIHQHPQATHAPSLRQLAQEP